MERPIALLTRPSPIVAALGGTVGVLLLAAVLHLGAGWAANGGTAEGAAAVELPTLLGAVFTASPAAAFWLGWALFFVLGAWLLPQALAYGWGLLPGRDDSIPAALGRGVLWSVALWVFTGLLLPVLGALSRVEGLAGPGLFGLAHGWGAFAALLAGFLAYGLAVGALVTMSQTMGVLELLGWPGYGLAGTSARSEGEQA